jgi:nucleotidyltransferase/DNA polymerase involved in DNA repair
MAAFLDTLALPLGLVRDRGLLMRSANFTLYGDISRRVVEILREAAPRVEVYSIDESFLDLSCIRELKALCRELRERVRRWTGIPNCIGIGPTKTLAKATNKVAKRARTQRELQGHACMELEEVEPDRQQIMVSRSFGARVEDPQAVHGAVATFAVRACEKLRSRGLVAAGVWVFAETDVFRPELRQHHPSRTMTLPAATADTRVVLGATRQLMRGMLKNGHAYKRAGIALLDLARPAELQGDLFSPATVGNDALMATLDRINQKFGRGTAGLGASGWQRKPEWRMRQLQLSPCYTTRFSDLPSVRC